MIAAEEIAAVLSALMNTSGGILVVQVVTGSFEIEPNLGEFAERLVKVITKQEKWIPEYVMSKYTTRCLDTGKKAVCFFVKQASHLITIRPNAYTNDGDDVNPMAEYEVLCSVLREKQLPLDHILSLDEFNSVLSPETQLKSHSPFLSLARMERPAGIGTTTYIVVS